MCSPTFILRLRLPEGMTRDEAIELLGATDCTDPLAGTGQPGVLALAFIGVVALSAIGDVARVIPEAVVLSFVPDGKLSS